MYCKRCTFLNGMLVWVAGVLFAAPEYSLAEKRPRGPLVVFVCGDHEYSGEQTLPRIAQELERRYGMRTQVLTSFPDQNAEENIPGLEVLKEADLAVFYLRWRRLPAEQVACIDAYLRAGKPVMGFRTSTHAFRYPPGHPLERWNAFGRFALAAPPGWGNGHFHYGHASSTDVTVIPEAARHPILTGVARTFHVRSWLYHVLPDYPPPGATRLLMGRAVQPDRPAVDNPVAWTARTDSGGRVFMTTMGHPEDFQVEAFQRLVINAVHWALGRAVPRRWAGPIDIRVPYRGVRMAQPLFDGRTLAGWEGDTGGMWRVEEGAIVGGSLTETVPQNAFLCTTREYRDFVLRLEFKLTGTEGFVNAGIQVRSKRLTHPPNEVSGYQADIGEGHWGNLYDESRRDRVLASADQARIRAIVRQGDWNEYVIRCDGRRIRLYLNGHLTVDYTETDPGIPDTGVIGLQIHGGGKAQVAYRAITLLELP